ncbi:unnamed protein product [Chrysoparadoxa australica]
MSGGNSLQERFIQFCGASDDPKGIHDSELMAEFGESERSQLIEIINSLLADNRIVLTQRNDGTLWYKLVNEAKAVKLKGLGPEQMLIYQVIERSSNRGIWTRDIKIQTSIQQQTLTKALKTLESRQLVKSVKSVTSKSKKLYMLYNIAPSKEITGGPWYTEQEFDHEFVQQLSSSVKKLIKQQRIASLDSIDEKIKQSGISKVPLTREELGLIVNSLVLDGQIEEVMGSAGATLGGTAQYRVAPRIDDLNYLTDVPCGQCPVWDQCTENGVISPANCLYMEKWLNLNAQDYE